MAIQETTKLYQHKTHSLTNWEEYPIVLCVKCWIYVYLYVVHGESGLPWWLDGKESACSAGDLGFIPQSGRSPWRKAWQPTPVFSPGEFHGQRSPPGYCPWGCKELDTTKRLTHTYTLNCTLTFLLICFTFLRNFSFLSCLSMWEN